MRQRVALLAELGPARLACRSATLVPRSRPACVRSWPRLRRAVWALQTGPDRLIVMRKRAHVLFEKLLHPVLDLRASEHLQGFDRRGLLSPRTVAIQRGFPVLNRPTVVRGLSPRRPAPSRTAWRAPVAQSCGTGKRSTCA